MVPLAPPNAFDLLHQQLDNSLGDVQEQIALAARQGAFDQADQYIKRARELTGLRKDLNEIEKRFGQLVEVETEEWPEPGQPPDARKFRKGLKTPQEEYRVPILQALVELGGRSELHPVLDRVYKLMKGRLNDYDHTVLPSDDATPRWRNTAQGARHAARGGADSG